MRIIIACILLTILSSKVTAQIQFEQILPPPPAPQITTVFMGVQYSSISYSDIDGDSDQDVLITGINNNNQPITKLYKNDGVGNFTLVTGTPFVGIKYGSTAFADIDNDGDQDLLITGSNNLLQPTIKLYKNNGTGNFTLVTSTQFENVHGSFVAFADVDNDGDKDVLITGQNSSFLGSTKLYDNDGVGNFTLVVGTPFDDVRIGALAFADVNNDGFQDILLTGLNSSSQKIAKLYNNDGAGNFSLETGTPFDGVDNGSVTFSDINNDGNIDVLITGRNNANLKTSKLYTNNGTGNFTQVLGTPFDDVTNSSTDITDIDNDGDNDILITGQNNSNQAITKLYNNDGAGNFILSSTPPFDGVDYGSSSFIDIDNDGYQDLLITGLNNFNQRTATLYINDGTGNLTPVIGSIFMGIYRSSIAYQDTDNDGDSDLLITGLNNSNQKVTELYNNDGIGNFTIVLGTPFDSISQGSIAFADVDNDGFKDVLITGSNTAYQKIAKLYYNDGAGNFTLDTTTIFEGVDYGSVAFADIDNDGDQDVLITGDNASSQKTAKLYNNDGTGNFTLVNGTPFDHVNTSFIAFADVDNDGDKDLLITGNNAASQKITKLYNNDGAGNFTLVTGTPFEGVNVGSVAFADINNDGFQDVVITGDNATYQKTAKQYNNDGTGNFTLVNGTPFDGVFFSSISFADVDNDGDKDLFITGENNSSLKIAKLYSNDGSGNFTLLTNSFFDGVYRSSIAFTDIDNDGFQDLLITGFNIGSSAIAKQYKNTTCTTTSSIDAQTACDNFTWMDGNTYTTSNNSATFMLTNIRGCDSVITLNLTISNNSGIDTQVACGTYAWIDGNTYTNSNNSATYTLTNSTGCDSVVTLDLTINSNNSGTDTQVACDTYAWIDGNTYTSSNNTATHTLTNAAGCDSLVTLDLTINTVDVSVITTDPNISANEAGAIYKWLDCNNSYIPMTGETSQNFTAMTNGDYAVEISKNNCTDTSACIAISTVAVDENNQDDLITIFPNPSKGSFNIDLSNLKTANINIYDLQGKLIYKADNITSETYQFKLEVEDGIYNLIIISEGKNYRFKLVKD